MIYTNMITKKDLKKVYYINIMNHFTQIAYKEALKSTMRVRVGAVLVYRNKIISTGYNKSRNNKIHTLNNQCLL